MLDRRIDERVTVDATASLLLDVDGDEREIVALSPRDISPSGAFLPHRDPPPVGVRGQLEVVVHSQIVQRLTGTAQLAVLIDAQVVRSEPGGFAVRFDQTSHRVELSV